MKHLNIKQWRQWPTEKLSSRVLYALVSLAVLVFVLFWLVGYDRPFADDPNFNAPLLTDALLVLMELFLLLTFGITAWSVARLLKKRGKAGAMSNNIPVKRIGYYTVCGTALLMVLSFLIGSSAPMKINGMLYTDVFWLKASDMFIYTSLLMMLVAVAAVIYGTTKYKRKP